MADDSFHNDYEKVVLESLAEVTQKNSFLTEDSLVDIAWGIGPRSHPDQQ